MYQGIFFLFLYYDQIFFAHPTLPWIHKIKNSKGFENLQISSSMPSDLQIN